MVLEGLIHRDTHAITYAIHKQLVPPNCTTSISRRIVFHLDMSIFVALKKLHLSLITDMLQDMIVQM